jgi:protein-tyrosine phosphatase
MRPDIRLRVCFVCSGNICRSVMAEVVLRRQAEEAGMGADVIAVDSAGTGDWHIGEHADERTVKALAARGYDGTTHRARQFDPHWFGQRDLVIALDRGHEKTLRSWAATQEQRDKVHLLRTFEPGNHVDLGVEGRRARGRDLDVADPYYDGQAAFDDVLLQIEAACGGLVDELRRVHERRDG